MGRRKTSLTLDGEALDAAHDLGINISAVADEAIRVAVAAAHRKRWLEENRGAFVAQADWHEKNGHPLAEILTGPGAASWRN